MRVLPRFVALGIALGTLSGCATRPVNEPIDRVDQAGGYRPVVAPRPDNDPGTVVILAFSGGGTRAAAFSYGVLEELRRTQLVVGGKPRRLLDEVDVITGVSGGSFTALSYALHGERLFDEYESRFLKRNVQGALTGRALNPANWPRVVSTGFGRSELAAEYYDEILFEGATFGDLLRRPAPRIVVTGTDISTGSRFSFTQNDFDLICSDLSKVRLSRAAATSSGPERAPLLPEPADELRAVGGAGRPAARGRREAAAGVDRVRGAGERTRRDTGCRYRNSMIG